MKILAGGGALPLAPLWNGVADDVGSDSIWTRTGRWRRRDSVKNLACMSLSGSLQSEPRYDAPLLPMVLKALLVWTTPEHSVRQQELY
jgi:hypothetical protein